MARKTKIQALRTTRAALDSNAGASNLYTGEFYWVTDEDSLAVGNAVNTYVDIGNLRADVDETITGEWGFPSTGFFVGTGLVDETDFDNFKLAFGWGDHASEGYLTSSSAPTLTDSWTFSNGSLLDVSGTGEIQVTTGALTIFDSGELLFDQGINGTVELKGQYDGSSIQPRWGNAVMARLFNPGADRLLMWDDSAGGSGDFAACTLGTNLSFSGTTLNATGGISDVVDDTSPQLGGTLDTNGNDINMGPNHLICDQRIAEHDGDADTYIEFAAANSFRTIVGGVATVTFGSSSMSVATDINMSGNNLICGQKIAEHFGDTNTHIDFPGLDQWSVTVGGTSMLEVGTSGVDVDGAVRARADVTAITTSGTTAIGSAQTGLTYYDTHATGTRSYRLDSADIGTQIEVHKNGAGTTNFTQGTSQTIIQGTSVGLKDKSAMVAKCVATNTWSVVGGAA